MPWRAEPRDDRAEHENSGYGEVHPVVSTAVTDDARVRRSPESGRARCRQRRRRRAGSRSMSSWSAPRGSLIGRPLRSAPTTEPNARGAAGRDVGRTCAGSVQIEGEGCPSRATALIHPGPCSAGPDRPRIRRRLDPAREARMRRLLLLVLTLSLSPGGSRSPDRRAPRHRPSARHRPPGSPPSRSDPPPKPPPWLKVENGATQPQFDLADAVEETLFVETTVDSDLDGKRDRVRLQLSRPGETETAGHQGAGGLRAQPLPLQHRRRDEPQRRLRRDAPGGDSRRNQRRSLAAGQPVSKADTGPAGLTRQLLGAARVRRGAGREHRHRLLRRLPDGRRP